MVTPQDLFDASAQRLQEEPQRVQNLTATFQFTLTGDGGGDWFLQVDKGKSDVLPGRLEHPDVTVIMKTVDFVNLGTGKLSGQEAFMTGKLKIKGNLVLGMRLKDILG